MKHLIVSFALLFAASSFATTCLSGEADCGTPSTCGPCSIKTVGVHEVESDRCPENEVMVGHPVDAQDHHIVLCARLACGGCSPANRITDDCTNK